MAKSEIGINPSNAVMERRHFTYREIDTTISLEHLFWELIDGLCRWKHIAWEQWASKHLNSKPENVGRARWLRNAVVVETVVYRRIWA